MKERAVVPKAEFRSYYGKPILKAPVWEWQIPAYFFAGGVAAGSSALAFGARVSGRGRLARRARWTSLAAISASTYFLIDDLGRPERFMNMLRVVKPTSPMSMGSWLLAVYGPAVGAAAIGAELATRSPGRAGRLAGTGARAADVVAVALSPAVCTYTAVIVADTAIPAWHDAHGVLPWVYASGAATSAGGLLSALTPVAEAAPARRLAMVGALAELVSSSRLDDVSRVYGEGKAARLSRISKALVAGGAATLALAGRRRPFAIAGGLAVATGAALQRFAVAEAGTQSAANPEFVITPEQG